VIYSRVVADHDSYAYGFGTTHWSQVVGAGSDNPLERRSNLERLCRQYWRPLYSHIRRFWGLEPAAAEDRTQEFFAYLLEHDILSRAAPELSRFRTFIKGVLRNFLNAERRRDGRLKRGGGQHPLSLDAAATDDATLPEVASSDPLPEEVLDREWARRVLELAREELARKLRSEGRTVDLEMFERYIQSPEEKPPTYAELARQFGLTEWDVWKRLSSLREELRTTMRFRVAETVRDPQEVDAELEQLLSLLK